MKIPNALAGTVVLLAAGLPGAPAGATSDWKATQGS
jgi:hypothetical protein